MCFNMGGAVCGLKSSTVNIKSIIKKKNQQHKVTRVARISWNHLCKTFNEKHMIGRNINL